MRTAISILLASLLAWIVIAEPATQPLDLQLRRRVESAPGSGEFRPVIEPAKWEPKKTAVVICDMWDQHWCKGASSRVAEMAPRMNDLASALRASGVLII